MKIIDDLLSIIDYETSVVDIRLGPFQTAVLTRHCGLASTPHDPGPHHSRTPVTEAGFLIAKNVRELACMSKSESSFEAAIGMATINSLIEIEEQRCAEINAGDNIQIGPVTFGVQINSEPEELSSPDSVILQPPEHLSVPGKQAVDQGETFLEPTDADSNEDAAAEILNSIGEDFEEDDNT